MTIAAGAVMASSSRLGIFASLLVLTGCFGGTAPGCTIFEPNGIAGNGSFHYDCVGAGDPECDDRQLFQLEGQLPSRPIARGSRFELTFLSGTQTVQPASTSAVRRTGPGGFSAERAGSIGFFVEAANGNGTRDIEDAIRLNVADPDRLTVGLRPTEAVFGDGILRIGGSMVFRATAFAKAKELAGAMPVTWDVDRPDIAEVESRSPGVCTLRGVSAGKVLLRATVDGLSGDLLVQVERGVTFGDAGNDDEDAATDAVTDATTDGGANDAALD